MIFFSKESQQQVHMHFYNALREGGYLVTSKPSLQSINFIMADSTLSNKEFATIRNCSEDIDDDEEGEDDVEMSSLLDAPSFSSV